MDWLSCDSKRDPKENGSLQVCEPIYVDGLVVSMMGLHAKDGVKTEGGIHFYVKAARRGLNYLAPIGIVSDKLNVIELKEAGKELCSRCGGTGNQLYSAYQKCQLCDGRGTP